MSSVEGVPLSHDPGARPMCSCGEMMMLARIEPGPPGVDLRTFECTKCDRSQTLAIPLRRET
jgi:hypothetical protein